jgi:hypothetical protein
MPESNREIWRLRKLILKNWRLRKTQIKKAFSHFKNIFDKLAKFRQGKKKPCWFKRI